VPPIGMFTIIEQQRLMAKAIGVCSGVASAVPVK
jgi:hypothetical protein